MLIEQIIEFKFRSYGPPSRTCSPTTGYFYYKTKTSKEYIRVDYCRNYYIAKILQEQYIPYCLLPGQNYLHSLTPKRKF